MRLKIALVALIASGARQGGLDKQKMGQQPPESKCPL